MQHIDSIAPTALHPGTVHLTFDMEDAMKDIRGLLDKPSPMRQHAAALRFARNKAKAGEGRWGVASLDGVWVAFRRHLAYDFKTKKKKLLTIEIMHSTTGVIIWTAGRRTPEEFEQYTIVAEPEYFDKWQS